MSGFIEVTQPELPDDLHEFSGDRVEAESDYNEVIFSGSQWSEQKVSQVRFDTVAFRKLTATEGKWRDVSLCDVRFQGGDLANANWAGVRALRTQFVSTRLVGFATPECQYEHSLFQNCRADYAVFQLTKLERCCFENCSLVEASFESATLKHVTFRNCNLRNVRFIGATLKDVDLRGSQLEGIGLSVDTLPEVSIDSLQTPTIAALTGVRIVDE